jgi:hypothetical protein
VGPIDILLGVGFPLLFGTGIALVTAGSGTTEFLVSRGCFVLAAVDVAALVNWWLYNADNSSWRITLAAIIGVAVIVGLPQLLKWADSRESASIAERQARVASDAQQIAPLIDVIRQLQSKLNDQEQARIVSRRILAQYEQLMKGINVFEQMTGQKDERDRVAAAEHIMKELQVAATNVVHVIDTPQGRGLVIKTAPNTFRVTFPVPMRVAPEVVFQNLPPGVTANVVEKSNIGFTVVFAPLTVPIDTIPGFSASAEL